MKVDLCMWAKNGAIFLPIVLKRIEKVIPFENINQKIFVDDGSTDDSVLIARDFNWTIYPNREGFVSGGVREALRHVKSEFFVSVEQDVILDKRWWDKIPPYMNRDKVAVACGVRLPTHSVLRAILQYMYAKGQDIRYVNMGRTLDNTIFKTKIIREIGVPSPVLISVDLYLYPMIRKLGFEWICDKEVISDHIRFGLINEENHNYKLSMLAKYKPVEDNVSLFKVLRILGTSPIRALDIALKTKVPLTIPYYLYQRLMATKRYIHKKARLGPHSN